MSDDRRYHELLDEVHEWLIAHGETWRDLRSDHPQFSSPSSSATSTIGSSAALDRLGEQL